MSHFLRDLQADYEREAVNWEATNFSDNRPCLDLLETNPGVFALVNEVGYLTWIYFDIHGANAKEIKYIIISAQYHLFSSTSAFSIFCRSVT